MTISGWAVGIRSGIRYSLDLATGTAGWYPYTMPTRPYAAHAMIVLIALACAILPANLGAQRLAADTAARIDAVFARYDAKSPGCAVNVLRADTSIYAKGYGLADLRAPNFMSGAFQLGGLTITWNRLWIIVFAGLIFAALLAALRYTALGLQMRAVTQNRRMASAMAIQYGCSP